jgi:beta-lactamase regulating signal transducer with metallopeptidase domain
MHRLLEIILSNAVVATLLAVAIAAFCRVCRRPALAHKLWLLVLIKLITPPVVTISLPWPAPAEIQGSSSAAPEERQIGEANASWPPTGSVLIVPTYPATPVEGDVIPQTVPDRAFAFDWSEAVIVVWLASSLLILGWISWHIWRFRRLLRYARPAPVSLRGRVQELAGRLEIRRAPEIWLVPGAVSPMLWALGGAPRLLFPTRLLDLLDREQLDALFLHELAHYRRRDHWVRYLEMAVLILYWWHPAAWWACRELREAEEQCCDAWVVWALAGSSRAYATALVQTVAFFSQARSALPAAASGIGQARQLRRRLTMIMQGKTPRSLSWLGGLVVLSVGLFLLPQLSVQAQEKEGKGDVKGRDEAIQKAIEFLKKAQGQDAGPSKTENKQQADEIKKALAASEEARRDLEAKWRSVRQAEERYNKALARLADLRGTAAPRLYTEVGGQNYYYAPIVTQTEKGPVTAYEIRRNVYVADPTAKGGPQEIGPDIRYWYYPKNSPKTETGKAGDKANPPAHTWAYIVSPNGADRKLYTTQEVAKAPPAGKDRTAALEEKLEQLTREVEKLRRELWRNPQPATQYK